MTDTMFKCRLRVNLLIRAENLAKSMISSHHRAHLKGGGLVRHRSLILLSLIALTGCQTASQPYLATAEDLKVAKCGWDEHCLQDAKLMGWSEDPGQISYPPPADEYLAYPDTGVALGNGWDTAAGLKTAEICVEGTRAEDTGRVVDQLFEQATDTASLMRLFSVSAKVKANSIVGGSASASASFAQKVNIQTDSLTFAVETKIRNGFTYLSPGDVSSSGIQRIKLKPELASLAKSDPAAFRQRCGDAFVASIERQSGIQGVYQIRTRSLAERQDMAAKLSFAGSAWSASASMKSEMDRLQKEGRLKLQYHQLGGAGLPVAISDEELRKLASSLGSTDAGAVNTGISVTFYGRLADVPVKLPEPATVAEQLANQYYRIMDIDRRLNEMLNDRTGYTWSSETGYPLGADDYIAGIYNDEALKEKDAIVEELQRCIPAPQTCKLPTNISMDDYGVRVFLPVAKSMISNWDKRNLRLHRAAVARRKLRDEAPLPGTSLCDQLMTATAELDDALLDLQRATIRARWEVWIDEPARRRCTAGSEACLNTSQRHEILSGMMNMAWSTGPISEDKICVGPAAIGATRIST